MTKDIKEALTLVKLNQQRELLIKEYNSLPSEIQEEIKDEISSLFEKYDAAEGLGAAIKKAWEKLTGAKTPKTDQAPPDFDPQKNPKDFDAVRNPAGEYEFGGRSRGVGGATADEIKSAQDAELQTKRMAAREPSPEAPKGADDFRAPAKLEPESPSKLKTAAKVVAGATLGGLAGYGANQLLNRDRQDAGASEAPAAPAETPKEEPAPKYKVAAGDTLSDLAKKNKVSVADIAKANDLTDIHKINVGQELVIPKATGNEIYKYGVGTKSGPKSSKDIKSLLQKQENRDKVNESLLAAFNQVVRSKHPNLFAEAAKKGSVPKTEKEKSLAALAEPKDKITHKDVLVGRGVVKEEEQLDEREVTDNPSYRFAAGLMGQFPTKHRNKLRITQDPDKPNTVYMGHKDSEGDYVQIKKHPKTGKIHWQAAYGATGRDYVHSPERAKKEITKLFSEEISFSEAELAHISSVVEAMAIAPTPTDYAPAGGIKKKTDGSKSGTLSDEYVEKGAKKPASTNVAKEVNSMAQNQQTHEIEFADKPGQKFTAMGPAPETHEIEFADKPGQKFKAMGPAPETHEIEFADKPGQKFTAMGPAPKAEPMPMSKTTAPLPSGSAPKGASTPMSAAAAEPAPYGTGSDGKPYKSSIYPDNPLEDAEKALENAKKLSSGALYKPTAKLSNASLKKVFEAKKQEDNEPVATGANKLHVNARKAADYNTPNVKHKFDNGEEVVLTKGMANDFLARHSAAKTADDKDAILKHANKSLDAFKSIARGGKVPSEPKASMKPKVSLGSLKGK